MASEKAANRKVPLWVWIVGGFLVIGLFGNLLGGGEQEIQAEEVESAQVEAEPVESVEAEEAQPVEAEVIEDSHKAVKNITTWLDQVLLPSKN